MRNQEAADKMAAAQSALMLEKPFWGELVMHLVAVEDPTCKTAWTDGSRVGYNADYVLALTHAQTIGLWAHEVGHCADGHCWRRDGRNMRRWNEAGDRVLNPMLRDDGITLPNNVLFELDATHKGKPIEWIYERLPRDDEPEEEEDGGTFGECRDAPAPQQEPDDSESDEGEGQAGEGDGSAQDRPESESEGQGGSESESDGEGQPESEGQPGSDSEGQDGSEGQGRGGDGSGDGQKSAEAGDGSGAGKADGPDDDGGQAGREDGQTGQEQGGNDSQEPQTGSQQDGLPNASQEDWQQRVAQAATMARMQGKLPAGLERFIEDAIAPEVDWFGAFLRFAQEAARSDYSWGRPSTRFAPLGLIMPSLHKREVGPVVFVVDSSGSVDSVHLAQAEAAARAMIEIIRPRETHVLYVDAAIQSVQVFGPDDELVIEKRGGGGTDFRPAFEYANDMDEQPVCIVYVTDMYGCFPEDEPIIPTLWVATTDLVGPFGETIHI